MFRIQRSANGKVVVSTLSGRIKEADLTELQKLLECEAGDHSLTLDLKEVRLVDRDVIGFVAGCKARAHWQRRTPEGQTEFIKVFSDLLEQTYVDKIESYNNEKFIYTNERIDGPYAEVGSKMRNSKGEEFSINYKLHRAGEDWRVYDLVIENVSLVNNYRSQFNRILTGSTYDELISKIKAKVSDKRDQMK